jgi:hypothetical protein
MKDHRRHKRFDATLEVEADVGKRCFPGRILRLSLGGCLLEIALNLQPGERIHLRISSAGPDAFKLKGEVRWVGGVGLGIKFLDLLPGAEEMIRGIIYKKLVSESRAAAVAAKRQDRRVMLGIPVRVIGKDIFDESFEERTVTENVSPNGACVTLRHFLSVGAKIELEAYTKFRAQAEVRFLWVTEKAGDLFSVGVQFLQTEGQWIVK